MKKFDQNGNVLFLILISVVLFAALSYSVMKTSRSGGGDVANEVNKLALPQLRALPNSLRQAQLRMMVNGTAFEDINFITPAVLSLYAPSSPNYKNFVFMPQGGGVSVSSSVAVNGQPRESSKSFFDETCLANFTYQSGGSHWAIVAGFQIKDVGTTTVTASTTGNDIIAILPCIKKQLCESINAEVGISGIPKTGDVLVFAQIFSTVNDQGGWPVIGRSYTIGETTGPYATPEDSSGLAGKVEGCYNGYEFAEDFYFYYNVILER